MSELPDETGFLELVVDQQCSFGLEEVHQQAFDQVQNLLVIVQIPVEANGYIAVPVFIVVGIRIFGHAETIRITIHTSVGVEATASIVVAGPVVFDRNDLLRTVCFDLARNAFVLGVDAADVFNFVGFHHSWTSLIKVGISAND